ncbi:Nucleoside-diphosphate-sugar epimerase [Paenibacillus sp. UNCCL117]|uniref:NAD-dependent epimerase/dehydratase family protein n=1 Tax=unclassified Paenibacillus TaxID=185978 RepID=UPI00088368B8|nr:MULTISPECIES: NAD-dependent epimerase/dehydratase family protein [unclassified Paenibacillus]SDC89297.1 Nucleoside-diphosphate-sugar epimerase [Paenibacillus sp. cl123]SFW28515.1 Nucleoside-diphosphate-sugar epimerase [Paenibacillus sp. UNCCL117]
MKTIQELEARMAQPSSELIRDIASVEGDILLLGVGGKMGPTLAQLAVNAIKEAGISKKVIGASRFSNGTLRQELEDIGVETIAVDLLNDEALQALPHVDNVLYMAGNKFGTKGNEHFTWAMNAYLPGRVAEKYKNSRIVAFSTGNVYPLTPVSDGGATEEQPTGPVGEYGQSCLGRERVFEHFARKNNTPMTIYRLNYAIDLRYGVLLEVAKSIKAGNPIDVTMGHVNCIWQGDANEIALRSLTICSTPPTVLNVTGPETISLRRVAEALGARMGLEPAFTGVEATDALLSNSGKCNQLFGYPKVSLNQMLDWVAGWVMEGGEMWNKPTHFQERKGNY